MAKKGFMVTLIDRAPAPLTRASLRNEGKIHLGLIYAKDESFNTAQYMLQSAMAFAPAIETIFGQKPDWQSLLARPFTYLALSDSMVPPDQLQAFYYKLEKSYLQQLAPGDHYLGQRLEWLSRPMKQVPGFFTPGSATAAWQTNEQSIHLPGFNEWVLKSIRSESRIQFLPFHQVMAVQNTAQGLRVECLHEGQTKRFEAELVVNCLWENRLHIDETMGLKVNHSWLYRLKHRVMARLPLSLQQLPSTTFVLGPYGDLVNYGSHRSAYLSWYPAGMRDWSTELQPPEAWNAICDGIPYGPEAEKILSDKIIHGLAALVPGMEKVRVQTLDAGIIYTRGNTDITDPVSELHKRFEVGICQQQDGYFSIDTGKLTSAPLHTLQLMEAIQKPLLNYVRA